MSMASIMYVTSAQEHVNYDMMTYFNGIEEPTGECDLMHRADVKLCILGILEMCLV